MVPRHWGHAVGPSSEDLVPALAESIARLDVGSRIPTIRELARTLHSTVASTHVALNRLEELGAVQTDRRGRNGVHLANKDAVRLWFAASRGRGPFLVALPLPTTLLQQGTATALRALFSRANLELNLAFIPGSRTRAMVLRLHQADAVVMSSLAAEVVATGEETVAITLPPKTMTNCTQVYTRLRSSGAARIRIGIDTSVADLARLTELEFRSMSLDLVDARAIQFGTLLHDGQIDAVIAREEDALLWPSGGWYGRDVSAHVRSQVGDSDTRAAVVTRSADYVATELVRRVIDGDELARVQQEVLAGRMAPSF